MFHIIWLFLTDIIRDTVITIDSIFEKYGKDIVINTLSASTMPPSLSYTTVKLVTNNRRLSRTVDAYVFFSFDYLNEKT